MQHQYKTTITWTGNTGSGTDHYTNYERSHTVQIEDKADILASSDTPFRGDGSKHNPEDFLLASLSSCHMLWYLHLCADRGIIVTTYQDVATGTLTLSETGKSGFTEVVLHPEVSVLEEWMIAEANQIHDLAHQKCFIANSVNFPVKHQPMCKLAEG